jgi:hypothetical protein
MNSKAMRQATLGSGIVFGAASLVLVALSVHYADDLADWKLPGLAGLAAIASNVMFMTADRLRRSGGGPS